MGKKTLEAILNAIVASTEDYITQQEQSARLAAASSAPQKSSGDGGGVDVMEGLTQETRLGVLEVLSEHLKQGASLAKASETEVRNHLMTLTDVDASKAEAIMLQFLTVPESDTRAQSDTSIDAGVAIHDYRFGAVILDCLVDDNVLPHVELAKRTVLTGAWDHQARKTPEAMKEKFVALLELTVSAGLVDIPEPAHKKKGKEEKSGTRSLVPVALEIRKKIQTSLTDAWTKVPGCADKAEAFVTRGESFHGCLHPLRQAKLEEEAAQHRLDTLAGVNRLQKQVRAALRVKAAKEAEVQKQRHNDQRERRTAERAQQHKDKEDRVTALWTAANEAKEKKHGAPGEADPVDHWGLSVMADAGNTPTLEHLKNATLLVHDLRAVAPGPGVSTFVDATMSAAVAAQVDRVSFIVTTEQRLSVYGAFCDEEVQPHYPTTCPEYIFGPSQEAWTMSRTVENAKRHPTLESLVNAGQPVGTPAGVIITVIHADARLDAAYLAQFQGEPGFNPRFATLAKLQNPIPGFATCERHRFEMDMSTHWVDPQDDASNRSYPAKDFPTLYAMANWFFHHSAHDDFCVVLGSDELAVVAAFQEFKLRYLYPRSIEGGDARAMKLIREMRFLQHDDLIGSSPPPPSPAPPHPQTHTQHPESSI